VYIFLIQPEFTFDGNHRIIEDDFWLYHGCCFYRVLCSRRLEFIC
jgi:hypothetical protein